MRLQSWRGRRRSAQFTLATVATEDASGSKSANQSLIGRQSESGNESYSLSRFYEKLADL